MATETYHTDKCRLFKDHSEWSALRQFTKCLWYTTQDPEVEKSDVPAIRAFYDLYKKSYDTPLCWDCALFRVLGYTEKYDDKRNGWFPVLLSLDMMYPQIIFHCIDDEMMDFDNETLFRSSVRDAVLWVVRLVSFEKMTLSCIIIFGYVVSTDNISLHRRWYDGFRLWERV